MRLFPIIFAIAGVLFSCVLHKKADDGVILTLPFGKYYNWTNWEMKQMNFRIREHELLIDTTYKLRPRDFRPHHTERLEDYPEIAKFLRIPVKELNDLHNAMNQIRCDSLHQFWIQYDDGTQLNLIKFWGSDNCDPTQHLALSSLYREMKMLQQKYKP